MINKEMVFIIGAGGSIPYGFPSGSGLVQEIINYTRQPLGFEILKNYNYEIEEIQRFSELLRDSRTPSIDLFLANQSEKNKAIGKFSIAKLIGEKIYASPTTPNDSDDWYRIIYTKMLDKFENIGENKISFITFNYDISLENYLYHAFRAFYNNYDENKLKEMLGQINFIHIYGSIDDPPWKKENPDIQLITSMSDFATIDKASKRIKTIEEGHISDKDILKAKRLMSTCEKIFITGFGYNETNIKIIGLNDPKFKGKDVIVGNSFGLGRAQKEDIGSILENDALVIHNHLNNSNFINEFVTFR